MSVKGQGRNVFTKCSISYDRGTLTPKHCSIHKQKITKNCDNTLDLRKCVGCVPQLLESKPSQYC